MYPVPSPHAFDMLQFINTSRENRTLESSERTLWLPDPHIHEKSLFFVLADVSDSNNVHKTHVHRLQFFDPPRSIERSQEFRITGVTGSPGLLERTSLF